MLEVTEKGVVLSGGYVQITLDRYEQLLDAETRLDVVVDLIQEEFKKGPNYLDKDDLRTFLYCAGYRCTVEAFDRELEEKKRKEQQENE